MTLPTKLLTKHQLCASQAIVERGEGFSFRVLKEGRIWPAFVIRFEGKLQGYLNVCAHAGLRLEGGSGEFFSRDGQRLVCRSHGASFEPVTGLCRAGPCAGLSLISLALEEVNDNVYLIDQRYHYYGS